jgi:hypothetical protein
MFERNCENCVYWRAPRGGGGAYGRCKEIDREPADEDADKFFDRHGHAFIESDTTPHAELRTTANFSCSRHRRDTTQD